MVKPVVIPLVIGFIFLLSAAHPDEGPHQSHDTRQVTLAGKTLTALVADTDLLRSRGLSGFSGLDDDQIMLFVFDRPGIHAFWMKQMRFAVDIAWIGEDLKIIHTQTRVGPESFPKIFTPPTPALFVIETRAGLLDSLNVTAGDTVGIR
jgi:uncharacterized protein